MTLQRQPLGRPLPERELVTVDEIARSVILSKMTIYRLIKSGELPALKIGRSFRIKRQDWLDLIERMSMMQDP